MLFNNQSSLNKRAIKGGVAKGSKLKKTATPGLSYIIDYKQFAKNS